jgi:hypothetical protein
MNKLIKFLNSVNNGENVLIIDNALSSLENPILRSLPFVTMAGIRNVTFPRIIKHKFLILPLENVIWKSSKELVKINEGGYAIFTNQNLEEKWTCKQLLKNNSDKISKGIITIIPDENFTLNQGLRPLLHETFVTENNKYYYATLLDELKKELRKNFKFSFSEKISPILLESICYITCIEKKIPSDILGLIDFIKQSKGYYFDPYIKKLNNGKISYSFPDLVDSLYWQIGGKKKDITHIALSWTMMNKIISDENKDRFEKRKEIVNTIMSKISHLDGLKEFFTRNIGD